MIKKLTFVPIIAVAAMALSTGKAEARGENEIVRLAHNIEKVGREIKNEFQTHYKRSSAYTHLMTDINDILRKAEHIDQLSHDPRTSYRHIKSDLAELDKLAHHLHDVVDGVSRGRYSGYVDGGLGHVHQKMDSLNDSIHSMERAIVAYAAPANNSCTSGNNSSYSANDYNRNRSARRSPAPAYSDWETGFRSLFGIFNSNNARPTHDGHNH